MEIEDAFFNMHLYVHTPNAEILLVKAQKLVAIPQVNGVKLGDKFRVWAFTVSAEIANASPISARVAPESRNGMISRSRFVKLVGKFTLCPIAPKKRMSPLSPLTKTTVVILNIFDLLRSRSIVRFAHIWEKHGNMFRKFGCRARKG